MAVIDNYLRLSEDELKSKDKARILDFLTFFPQPDTRVWVYKRKPSTGQLWLPRGVLDLLPSYVEVRDKRSFPKCEKFEPNITLDYKGANKKFYGQTKCVQAMREHKQGTIHRQPGTGKTQIALYFAATIGTRTLVIVHTEDILQQWLTYAQNAIPEMDIDIERRSHYADGAQLVISTVQTLFRRDYPIEWYRQFGCTFLDECHHGSARTFDEIIQNVTSRYLFGLSASKTRADKMENLVRYNFGPIIHEQKFASPIPVTVERIRTNFRPGAAITGPLWLRRKRWHSMINRLTTDPKRNAQIAKWVSKCLSEGRSTLVLSRRIEHLQLIQKEIDRRGYDSVILAAKLLPKRERKQMVEKFRNGEIKCVLATQLADEALDVPILSAIALTYPSKHTELILQQVGRALREYKGKENAVIADFADLNVKSLRSQWHGRRGFYLRAGFKVKGIGLRGRINPSVKKAKSVVLGRIR